MAKLWTPPEHEVSPLEEAISAVVRAQLIPTADTGVPLADPKGWVSMRLHEDQEARISILFGEPTRRHFEARTMLAYSFTGHATLALEGHRIRGLAMLDLQSTAFLVCEIDIESVGKLA